MPKPLVSVCIPVWNREHLLSETLDSVLGQTYDDLEVLVVDNASTDGSADVARRYAARDSRVRLVVNGANIGGMPNYRRCLELATGDYLKFCNSDDLLPPSLVTRLAAGLEDPGVGLAFARQSMIDESGRALPPWLPDPVLPADGHISGRTLGDASMLRSQNLIGCPTATLFRRRELPPASFSQFVGERFWVAGDLTTWLTLLADRNAAYVHSTPAVIRLHVQQETTSNPAVRVVALTDWLGMALRAPAAGYLLDPGSLRVALANSVQALAAQPDLRTPTAWSRSMAGGIERGAQALALLSSESPDVRAVLDVPLDFRQDPDDAQPMDGGGVRWTEHEQGMIAASLPGPACR
jgi:hypothetical protein